MVAAIPAKSEHRRWEGEDDESGALQQFMPRALVPCSYTAHEQHLKGPHTCRNAHTEERALWLCVCVRHWKEAPVTAVIDGPPRCSQHHSTRKTSTLKIMLAMKC